MGGVTYSTRTIGGVLRTGQSPVAGCYEQDRNRWGITYMTRTIGGVFRTGRSPVAVCYEQDRDRWRCVKNRTGTTGGVLGTGKGQLGGVTYRTGTIDRVLRTGQGPLGSVIYRTGTIGGCYIQDRDH